MCDELTAVYLVDANVLIDYLNSDISILTIYSKEIGQIYIPVEGENKVPG
jgi:hypothetical protein